MWWQPTRATSWLITQGTNRGCSRLGWRQRESSSKRKWKQNPTTGTKKCAIKASGSEIPPERRKHGEQTCSLQTKADWIMLVVRRAWAPGGWLYKAKTSVSFDQPQVSEAADSVACLIDVSDNERGIQTPLDIRV